MTQAGWYWVKQVDHPDPGYWEVAFWTGSFWEFHEQYPVVGPRIPTPEEPWQCVPVEPTPDMLFALDAGRAAYGSMRGGYRAMLEAARRATDGP